MALLTPVNAATTGVRADDGAAATGGGDTFVNTGYELFAVKNGSASSINVTVTAVAGSNAVVAVAAGTTFIIGPFPPCRFNANGIASVSYSTAASVLVKVVRAYVPDAECSF